MKTSITFLDGRGRLALNPDTPQDCIALAEFFEACDCRAIIVRGVITELVFDVSKRSRQDVAGEESEADDA